MSCPTDSRRFPTAGAVTAAVSTEAPERAEPASADELLNGARRLDWRFLLPDPRLKRLLYVGSGQGTLLESLRRLSESVVIYGDSARELHQGEFELVVAEAPSHELLAHAARYTARAGTLYVEGYRWRSFGKWGAARRQVPGVCVPPTRASGSTARPADYMAVLKGLGLTEIEAYWHWPDFERCRRIVPLSEPALVARLFEGGQSAAAQWLRRIAGRCVARSGMALQCATCFSLVARRGAE